MMNWYEIPGALDDLEHNPAYLEKMAICLNSAMLSTA